MRNVGRTYLFRLNERNYAVEKLLLPLFTDESRLLQAAIEELAAGLSESVVSIILYGSVSRQQERPFSDVDFLVLVATEADRRNVQALFHTKNESFTARFGHTLSLLVLPVAEFRRRYRKGDALIVDVVNTGRVISGQLISEVMG